MKILVYGINYAPELTGIGKYSGEMCSWLAANGHEVRVVTAPPYYPDWSVSAPFSPYSYKTEWIDGVKVMRCPLYVPKKPSTIKRILHLCSFAMSSGIRLFSQLSWRPDVLICVVPTQFCSPIALLYSSLSRCKSVIHIQDYELDAMFGLGMAGGSNSSDSRVKRAAFAVERWLLSKFHRVSSISNSMLNKANEKGIATEQLMFFPNWSETSRFLAVSGTDTLKAHLNIPPHHQVALYSGNIGEKQGLESVIEVAERMQSDSVTFLIVGQGAGKERLVLLAEQKRLQNVIFSPLLPYEQLPTLLSIADCHLVIQKKGAADAVLPSKLTNILAIGGQSVITAECETELGMLCQQYPDIAVRVDPENVEALYQGIGICLEKPRFNAIAQNYATQFIDKESVMKKLVLSLNTVLSR
ncbi:colanic acid biosynthesis glycosyltransferase WcaI [Pokkaliibacter plantistimulans]|uniref:Colanic acid biosynthesis glycosyltransferase WcaI n=1 Tax=Proteobacteria bacterium 228 TaxID=2083153 RepID=A0A2S5KJM1_9PROT|nr:glycosyltransferase WbuB [Pokkaliibacter plantistimulans]PPC74960.1 colanic acid biosynthesis glycosyltransferase WcaI [Pokkaliibacter plantistimulans]